MFPMARARTTLLARFQSPHLPRYRPLCCALDRVSCCWGRTEHIIIICPLLHPLIPPFSRPTYLLFTEKNQPKNTPKKVIRDICHQTANSKPRAYIYRHFPSTHSPPSDVDLGSIQFANTATAPQC